MKFQKADNLLTGHRMLDGIAHKNIAKEQRSKPMIKSRIENSFKTKKNNNETRASLARQLPNKIFFHKQKNNQKILKKSDKPREKIDESTVNSNIFELLKGLARSPETA